MSDNSNYGYVTITNEKYLNLARIVVDHINEFSKYKIHLFTINCDANFDYPCLIKDRVNIKNANRTSIICTKIYGAINSGFDFGLILDADMIPLPTIDDVIDDNLKFSNCSYPICAMHPDYPHRKKKVIDNLKALRRQLNCKSKIKKYVYANYLFSKNSFGFLEEYHKTCLRLIDKRLSVWTVRDEYMLNVLLSELDSDYNDLGYNHIPNYYAYNDYINNNHSSEHIKFYTDRGCPVKFNSLHGCKDVKTAKKYSDLVKSTKDKFLNVSEIKMEKWQEMIYKGVENAAFLNGHMGLIDLLVYNSAVRYFTIIFDDILIPIFHSHLDTAKFMWSDLANVHLIPVSSTSKAQQIKTDCQHKGFTILFSGKYGAGFDLNLGFPRVFYKQLKLNYKKTFKEHSKIVRDYELEKEYSKTTLGDLYGRRYALLCNEESCNSDLPKIKIKDVNSGNIFKYLGLIENAEEIHCKDNTALAWLADSINLERVNKKYMYMNRGRKYPTIYFNDWEFIL